MITQIIEKQGANTGLCHVDTDLHGSIGVGLVLEQKSHHRLMPDMLWHLDSPCHLLRNHDGFGNLLLLLADFGQRLNSPCHLLWDHDGFCDLLGLCDLLALSSRDDEARGSVLPDQEKTRES